MPAGPIASGSWQSHSSGGRNGEGALRHSPRWLLPTVDLTSFGRIPGTAQPDAQRDGTRPGTKRRWTAVVGVVPEGETAAW